MMSRSVQLVRRVLSIASCSSLPRRRSPSRPPTLHVARRPDSDLPLDPDAPAQVHDRRGHVDVARRLARRAHDRLRPRSATSTRCRSAAARPRGSRAARASTGSRASRPTAKSIVFVSDRSGSENLWLVDADGQRVRPITNGRNAGVRLARLHAGRPVHRRARRSRTTSGSIIRTAAAASA